MRRYPCSRSPAWWSSTTKSTFEAAGLVTVGTDAEGQETWMLTPTGEQIALQMSMSSEDDAAALLDALLDAAEPSGP